MASSGADDDFDSWIAQPTPGSAAAARAKDPPTSSGSWFGGSLLESFNSTTASLASTLTSDPLLKSVGDQLSGVAGQLRQHLDDSVSAFKEEEARYCTEEAQAAERAKDDAVGRQIAQHVAEAATDAAAAAASAAAEAGVDLEKLPIALPISLPKNDGGAAADGDAAAAGPPLWDDAPVHLRDALRAALQRLSASEDSFVAPPKEAAAPSAAAAAMVEEELRLLLGRARDALAHDADLRGMRFKLVPSRVSEANFWRHYLLRVLRERRLMLLPPPERPAATAAAWNAASNASPAAPVPAAAAPPAAATAAKFDLGFVDVTSTRTARPQRRPTLRRPRRRCRRRPPRRRRRRRSSRQQQCRRRRRPPPQARRPLSSPRPRPPPRPLRSHQRRPRRRRPCRRARRRR